MLKGVDYPLRGLIAALVAMVLVSFSSTEHPRAPENDQPKATSEQKADNLFLGISPEGWTAIFTGVLTVSTIGLWWATFSAARDTRDATRIIERAYVKMSHLPPGITWIEPRAMAHAIIAIKVKNFGRTPAHVTDVHVEGRTLQEGEELPRAPQYQLLEGRAITSAFLVTDDEFIHRVIIGMPPRDLEPIKDGSVGYSIFGYVDYRDRFGERHRGCFARSYDVAVDDTGQYTSAEDWQARNNLTISEQPLYNDDRPRVRGEGNDWD